MIDNRQVVELPEPSNSGRTPVEEALANRRSVREYSSRALTLGEVSQLLWAAQGITEHSTGKRTAPSAGALYPLEIYLVAGNVEGLTPAVYRYLVDAHQLVLVKQGDMRADLGKAALDQTCVGDGSAVLVFAAIFERTTQKYGERGVRYVHMEVGHAAQNVYLQATALDLGTVIVGAFHDFAVQNVLEMPENEKPLAIMPVGRR